MSVSTQPALHVCTVAVCYHLSPAELIAQLQALAPRQGTRLHGIVVSNNPVHPLTSPSIDFEVIRGSNAHLDFSGYFEGLGRLRSTRSDVGQGNVLFVNDSLFSKHAAGCILGHVLRLDRLFGQLALPAIGGKADPYRSICLRNPWSDSASYVSSFCFLLNALALPLLQALPADADADGALSPLPLGDPHWGAGMPPILREQIRAHLAYQGSPYLWPGAKDPNNELLPKKARCVYFEHRLSGAIGSAGAVVPINSGARSRADIFINEMFARLALALKGLRR
jgi:hypothetical protein